jgi:hypothetical protein|tara:strand:+ start:647 stop:826 length:180 start_codon:yes stop_codon:yes gene_type:complete
MRKITFKIEDSTSTKNIEFITDRTVEWTEEQYSRNREPLTMELISDEATEETEAVSREI